MKGMTLLVWMTQLGLSVALPPVGFILLSVWLRERFDLGIWIVVLGVLVGVLSAVEGLRNSLKAMARMSEEKRKEAPPVSFNDHE